MSHQAFFAQAEVIRELADEGPCVIVGRCSDYVLGERPECLKVFIHADLPSRVERCVEEYHIPSDDMERRVIQMDRGRSNYYNYYTGHNWGDMRRYDLTINSSNHGDRGSGGAHCGAGPRPLPAGRGCPVREGGRRPCLLTYVVPKSRSQGVREPLKITAWPSKCGSGACARLRARP